MKLFKYSHVLNNSCIKKMDNWNQQLFEMLGRLGEHRHSGSKAAAVVGCQMRVANNPNRRNNYSKAASIGVPRQDKAKVIADFLSNNH